MDMPRPQTKVDLIEAAQRNYEKLLELIQSMNQGELDAIFCFEISEKKKEAHWKRDKNIRDVIIHLYEWHKLLIDWVEANMRGERKSFLMEGYNWKTYGDMNVVFWNRNQNVSLEDALQTFKETHKKVMELIESMSNEELFQKNVFDWVGGSTLGSYFISNTSSHYDWAMKKIKMHKKSIQG